jgi:hypothetical protein
MSLSCCVSTVCTSKSKSKGPECISNAISGHAFEVIVTDETPNSMEQSPVWKAAIFLTSQLTPCMLWNLKFHYHAHNSLSSVAILSHLHILHVLPSCFFKFGSMISSHWCLGLQSGLFPSYLPTKTVCIFLVSVTHALPTSSFIIWPPE